MKKLMIIAMLLVSITCFGKSVVTLLCDNIEAGNKERYKNRKGSLPGIKPFDKIVILDAKMVYGKPDYCLTTISNCTTQKRIKLRNLDIEELFYKSFILSVSGCPLILTEKKIICKENKPSKLFLTFLNVSDNTINAYKLSISCYNTFNELLEKPFVYLLVQKKHIKKHVLTKKSLLLHKDTIHAMVMITDVSFIRGRTWKIK